MPIALFRVAGKAVPVCDTGCSGVRKSPFGDAGKPLSRDVWRMAVWSKVLPG